MATRALLINPWIYDFAAYDLWARPLGLLYLSAWLKKSGWDVRLVDALDRLHPESGAPASGGVPISAGRWRRRVVPTPEPLADVPRRFARYGLPRKVVEAEIARRRPDLILVGSSMTYWYPGAWLAVETARRVWPDVPIVLGGTYAALCQDHAQGAGADLVVSGRAEDRLPDALDHLFGSDHPRPVDPGPDGLTQSYWPDLDHYSRIASAPLMTSRGCPHHCPYCASNRLHPVFCQRPVDDLLAEIEDRRFRLGVREFAFFDDALLVDSERRFLPLLETVVRRQWDVRFHAPNGLHVAAISAQTARLMKAAGFQTVRLGLESLDPERQKAIGDKAAGRFGRAVANLKKAGFSREQIGVYILFGLPGQPLEEVLGTADQVKALGARPYAAEYSPLPHTRLWPEAVAASPFDLAAEPLYHNNTFFPCRPPGFSYQRLWAVKRRVLG